MIDIPIPDCYRRPFKRWLQDEYRSVFCDKRPSESQLNGMMATLEVHIRPVLCQTSIVFAVCRDEDDRMIRAIKIPRQIGPADARFIMRVMAIAK